MADPTLLERQAAWFAQHYGPPAEQPPSPDSTPSSVLGNVVAAPPPTQTQKVAATYAQRSVAPQRSSANVSAATAEQQRAVRDATWPHLTSLQKMAARYGTSSRTVPAANFPIAEYRRKTDEAGVDPVTARKILDGLLATADSGIPAGAGTEEYHRRTREMGIEDDAARKCLEAFLSLGAEPSK